MTRASGAPEQIYASATRKSNSLDSTMTKKIVRLLMEAEGRGRAGDNGANLDAGCLEPQQLEALIPLMDGPRPLSRLFSVISLVIAVQSIFSSDATQVTRESQLQAQLSSVVNVTTHVPPCSAHRVVTDPTPSA